MIMKNLQKLIKDTRKESKSKWAIKEDLAEMYKADAADYEAVMYDIAMNNYPGAEETLNAMDTLPRDNAILNLAYDMGVDWVREKLGWDIDPSFLKN